jgi:DnaJ-class molecular chaperone
MNHYYKVLGLKKTASKQEIKAAFKKLVFQCHPDKYYQSPKSVQDNATRRFKQVSEAYEVLMDDRKRAQYNYRQQTNAGGGSAGGAGKENAGASKENAGAGRRSATGSSAGARNGWNYNSQNEYYEYKSRSGRIDIRISRSFLLNLGFSM